MSIWLFIPLKAIESLPSLIDWAERKRIFQRQKMFWSFITLLLDGICYQICTNTIFIICLARTQIENIKMLVGPQLKEDFVAQIVQIVPCTILLLYHYTMYCCTDCTIVQCTIVHRLRQCTIFYCTQILPCSVVHGFCHAHCTIVHRLYTDCTMYYCTQIVPVPTESDAERIDGYQCKVCGKKFRWSCFCLWCCCCCSLWGFSRPVFFLGPVVYGAALVFMLLLLYMFLISMLVLLWCSSCCRCECCCCC